MNQPTSILRQIITPAVIVGALGYFVDVYDLILFAILRIPSLKDMGFSGELLVSHGILLLNLQMLGMLVGGIFFGVLGDRFGRVALLSTASLRLRHDPATKRWFVDQSALAWRPDF